MCFTYNRFVDAVERNSEDQQQKLEYFLQKISAKWNEDCDREDRIVGGIRGVIRTVLLDENGTYGPLSAFEFAKLARGCGCCRRHAHRFDGTRRQHCKSYENNIPTSRTPENKLCDHACRCWGRVAHGMSLDQRFSAADIVDQ